MNDDTAQFLKDSDGGLFVPCHVRPGAKKNAFKGLHGEALKFDIKAPPVDGKANAELREFLSDELGVPKSSVEIVSGESSREKRVFIRGLTSKDFLKVFPT